MKADNPKLFKIFMWFVFIVMTIFILYIILAQPKPAPSGRCIPLYTKERLY